ncbi:hypothetical protein [Nostoc sp. MG11]|uniref:hypothetical protein n=1 Tax=Nostoc sp. MG11 TaxID=2721166 RepID=UPI001868A379|nr:hypothetical protein [Nostoc sp. MG11]
MANIKIDDIKNLHPAGAEFFGDNESYMSELTEDAVSSLKVWGGTVELTSAATTGITGELSGLTGELSAELTSIIGL